MDAREAVHRDSLVVYHPAMAREAALLDICDMCNHHYLLAITRQWHLQEQLDIEPVSCDHNQVVASDSNNFQEPTEDAVMR